MSDAMYALYKHANLEPEFACWLVGADESLNYCSACADKRHAAGQGEFVGGGYGPSESDTCVHCEDCGVILSYWLTRHGVESELDHFRGRRFRSIGADDAFHIARLVDSAPTDQRTIKLAERAARAIGSKQDSGTGAK